MSHYVTCVLCKKYSYTSENKNMGGHFKWFLAWYVVDGCLLEFWIFFLNFVCNIYFSSQAATVVTLLWVGDSIVMWFKYLIYYLLMKLTF